VRRANGHVLLTRFCLQAPAREAAAGPVALATTQEWRPVHWKIAESSFALELAGAEMIAALALRESSYRGHDDHPQQ